MSERVLLTPEELTKRRRTARSRRSRRRRLAALGALAACVAPAVLVVAPGIRSHVRHAPAAALVLPARRARIHRRGARPSLRARELAAIRRAEAKLPFLALGGRRRREIALTFDDGPGPYTLGVLKVLRHLRVPATFFQIGFMIPEFPAAERALLADRDVVLGDHTERHPMLGRIAPALQYQQINDAAGMQAAHGAPWPHLFRPPYGSFDAATLAVLRRLHMLMVMWSVDSMDYRKPGVATIVSRVLKAARPGAIVLMHDAGGTRTQTIQALPIIIRRLRARHFRLVTVPRMLLDDPPRTRQSLPARGAG